ncbi:MAG: MBL fold metallo-hydrolase [Cyanobacteria bacterium Co-bin13]|nr:MBL fold metallo-hydrolase [Cyanobacteria bacterium Co-bin13]
MKRRRLLQYAGTGLFTTLGMGALSNWQGVQAQTAGVTVRWLGHTCFLFTGDGRRILVNPFRRIGCTAGYRPPNVQADLVMISSRLFDEGYLQDVPGDPRVLAEPGTYGFTNMQVQGIPVAHDRQGGRRFGTNVIWKWNQGGLNLVHMGGAAAPVDVEEQILLGRPDVLMIPVGGGPKAYTAEEAVRAIQTLRPKLVIPTQYRTQAADAESCDITALDDFLQLMQGTPIARANGDTVALQPASLPTEGMRIQVMNYSFG